MKKSFQIGRKIVVLVFLSCVSFVIQAQGVGIGTNDPHMSAKLDISSSERGLLIPRVPLNDVASAIPVYAPAEGLLIVSIRPTPYCHFTAEFPPLQSNKKRRDGLPKI